MNGFLLTETEEKLPGVGVFYPDVFEDYRGRYIQTYREDEYSQVGCPRFVEDDVSISTKHVLRGIHGDRKTWKLISCLHGSFYFVVVNCTPDHEEFGNWQSWTLSDRNRMQVLVPPWHGNAHLVLSDTAIFSYKQSQYYDREGQFTYAWNDPDFDIWWPIKNPIVSQRDEVSDVR